ncbi:hypothetical protein [Nocardia colli]|uniref:hypothetical protein n=1 Tax=Nocardia colli TaxID=2545717 RepID=UPI0035DF1852
MKRIIAGTVFAAAIAAGVTIAAGPATADNGVIHTQEKPAGAASTPAAAPDATAIEYGLAVKSGGGSAAARP